jgi:hypothetical protein
LAEVIAISLLAQICDCPSLIRSSNSIFKLLLRFVHEHGVRNVASFGFSNLVSVLIFAT